MQLHAPGDILSPGNLPLLFHFACLYIYHYCTRKYFDWQWDGMTRSFCLGNTGLWRMLMLRTERCWQHMILQCQTWVSLCTFVFMNIKLVLKLSSKKKIYSIQALHNPATVVQIIPGYCSMFFNPTLKRRLLVRTQLRKAATRFKMIIIIQLVTYF